MGAKWNYQVIGRKKLYPPVYWNDVIDPTQGVLIYQSQKAAQERIQQLRDENNEWEYTSVQTNGMVTIDDEHQCINPWYSVVQEMIEYMGLIPGGAYTDPKVALQNMKDRWDSTYS